jgi:YggT family protein
MEPTPVLQGGVYLFQFLSGLLIFTLIFRFLLRASYIDWHHPIVQFTAKITNPLCAPINRLFPVKGRWDWGALITAMLIQAILVIAIGLILGRDFSIPVIFISAITEVLNQILDMLFWLIVINIVLSWVGTGYNANTAIFTQLAEPILSPFQKLVPPMGGFDFSPIIAILAIKLTQIVVVGSIAQLGQSFIS